MIARIYIYKEFVVGMSRVEYHLLSKIPARYYEVRRRKEVEPKSERIKEPIEAKFQVT